MIAKSFLVTFLLAMGIGLHAKSPYETNYFNILKVYDIHPPVLKYGYPLWYQYDSLPVTGIIYLKDDLTDLHKINDITYVAEPTAENAKIILNFSGEVGVYPKFYIVPDSSLELRKVIDFIELLTFDYGTTNILFCGGSGKYFNILSKDYSEPKPTFACGAGYRTVFEIMNNCKHEVYVEGEIKPSDSLTSIVEDFYFGNYKKDEEVRGLYRNRFDSSACLSSIKYWTSRLNEKSMSDSTHTSFYYSKIGIMQELLSFCRKKQFVYVPLEGTIIWLKDQYCGKTVAQYYETIEFINRGVLIAREERAKQFAQYSYVEMIYKKRVNHLEYIHVEFPDLMQHGFERYPEPPPPPLSF